MEKSSPGDPRVASESKSASLSGELNRVVEKAPRWRNLAQETPEQPGSQNQLF